MTEKENSGATICGVNVQIRDGASFVNDVAIDGVVGWFVRVAFYLICGTLSLIIGLTLMWPFWLAIICARCLREAFFK